MIDPTPNECRTILSDYTDQDVVTSILIMLMWGHNDADEETTIAKLLRQAVDKLPR